MRKATPAFVLSGVVLAMLPVLFPVWDRSWVERPSSGSLAPAVLSEAGMRDRIGGDQRRGFLFTGPSTADSIVGVVKVGSRSVSWWALNTSAHVQWGRMLVEAGVLLAPFLIFAIWLRPAPAAPAASAPSALEDVPASRPSPLPRTAG